jgi:radical SAM superfamily enzyme YgiQ (UPF0313 family)
MKVLLVNNGEPDTLTSQKVYKRVVPQRLRTLLKPHAALLPGYLQRRLITSFGISEKRFPLGLGYLSAMLKAGGHEVELVDRFADPGTWVPDSKAYDFVGVYSSSPFFHDCLAILDQLDRDGFEGKIAFGGPHPAVLPRTIPSRVDYVVQGEAEYVICDLVEGRWEPGVQLRTARIQDLDALPRADFDLFLKKPRSYLNRFAFSDREPIFNLATSRSCPYNCSFCGVRDIWGHLWRAQSAERVVDDILYLKRTYGIAGVYFREDLFTGNKKRVRRIAELLIEKEANIIWACESRVDAGSDEELVALMARSGCVGLYIGAESGSQRMLDHYNKDIKVEQIYRTCRNAKKHGIAVFMSLIVAHPEETWQDKVDTWRLLLSTRPETFGLAPYRPEFARHGDMDLPEYPERPTIQLEPENSTWKGQSARFSYLNVENPAPKVSRKKLPVLGKEQAPDTSVRQA